MKEQEAPGTTFKKHLSIARGLLSEDDYLLTEILLSPHSLSQVERINEQMEALIGMIRSRDKKQLKEFFGRLRGNIGLKP
jgi:prephenate dehydrogenase